jgi:predicted enzyme related to lactoylglutathione lyase
MPSCPKDRRCGPIPPEFSHIAFHVDDVADAATAVPENGIVIGERVERDLPRVGRFTFQYLTDPEGNLVEVQSWA